jgi:hypothetical protein
VKWIAPNGERWILSNLASQQNLDGSWGPWPEVKPAYTGLVLTKLQMHAYETRFDEHHLVLD